MIGGFRVEVLNPHLDGTTKRDDVTPLLQGYYS
jgi:hypothetical protein